MLKLNRLLPFLFYGFFALAIMAPLTSNTYLPMGDFLSHTAAIVEAKNALRHHQFPLRVAPNYGQKWFYPTFQFYSPFPYTIAGLIHKVIKNPFFVLKIVMWLFLTLGGIFMFRLCHWLTGSKPAGLLAGVVYLLSPYLIINVAVRGDFTESIAQGVLPIALYYAFRTMDQVNLRYFLMGGIAWSMLLTTHIITFAYGILFLLILLMLYVVQKQANFKNVLVIILSIGLGCLLALWFFAPVMLYARYLYIFGATVVSPAQTNWLTPLASLLAFKSISPIPLPSSGQLLLPLYFSIGLPIAMSFGAILYAFFIDKDFIKQKFILALAMTFLLAFFAAWTPFDFWKWLPTFFDVVQFSYRILAHVMWLGSILFAFVLVWLFKDNLDARVSFILLGFIIIAGSSWIYNAQAGPNDKVEGASYFYKADPVSNYYYRVEPSRFPQKDLPLAQNLIQDCIRGKRESKICHLIVKQPHTTVALPILYFPDLLRVTVNDQPMNYLPLAYKDTVIVGLQLEPGVYKITAKFTGLVWANWICWLTWLAVFMAFLWIFYQNRFTSVNHGMSPRISNPLG